MGYNVHDVLRRVVFYYTKQHKKFKNNYDYDLKLLSFLKMRHTIYKGINTFSRFHIYSQKKIFNHLLKQLYQFFITIFKIKIKKFIGMKKFFWGKKTCPFLK